VHLLVRVQEVEEGPAPERGPLGRFIQPREGGGFSPRFLIRSVRYGISKARMFQPETISGSRSFRYRTRARSIPFSSRKASTAMPSPGGGMDGASPPAPATKLV